MSSALAYIHSQKTLHRDLKPLNIFISRNSVKIGACFIFGTHKHTHRCTYTCIHTHMHTHEYTFVLANNYTHITHTYAPAPIQIKTLISSREQTGDSFFCGSFWLGYLCVCLWTYVCVDRYTHINICTYKYPHIHSCTYIHVHNNILIHMCVCVHTHIPPLADTRPLTTSYPHTLARTKTCVVFVYFGLNICYFRLAWKVVADRTNCAAATHVNALQHTATHCNTVPYAATRCNTL